MSDLSKRANITTSRGLYTERPSTVERAKKTPAGPTAKRSSDEQNEQDDGLLNLIGKNKEDKTRSCISLARRERAEYSPLDVVMFALLLKTGGDLSTGTGYFCRFAVLAAQRREPQRKKHHGKRILDAYPQARRICAKRRFPRPLARPARDRVAFIAWLGKMGAGRE